jgi:hypothetical protein
VASQERNKAEGAPQSRGAGVMINVRGVLGETLGNKWKVPREEIMCKCSSWVQIKQHTKINITPLISIVIQALLGMGEVKVWGIVFR